MTRGTRITPRSAVLVAVMAFGAVALVGTMIGLVAFGVSGGPAAYRNGVGIAGLVAAAIAYVIQRRKAQQRTSV